MMVSPFIRHLTTSAAAFLFVTAAAVADGPTSKTTGEKVDFLRDVRPILAGHCLKCHGQDEDARKGKLRLDVRDNAIKPAKSGEVAIVPGRPDKSELVRRIFAEDDDQMPPEAAKRPLTQEQKEILKRWVAEGAEYKPHWAFIKPAQQSP